MKVLPDEQIVKNYDSLINVINKSVSEPRKSNLLKLFDEHSNKIAMAPASSYPFLHNAFAGGYVDHTINVIKMSRKVYTLWKELNFDMQGYTEQELIFCALVHDLGKMGNLEHENYIPNESEWHIKNQQKYFNPNPDISYMKIQDRTLFLLQHYNIQLSENEYIAIMTHDGMYDEGNKAYYTGFDLQKKFKTNLPYILHHGDMMATRFELERWKNTEIIPKETKEEVKIKKVSSRVQLQNEFDATMKEFE